MGVRDEEVELAAHCSALLLIERRCWVEAVLAQSEALQRNLLVYSRAPLTLPWTPLEVGRKTALEGLVEIVTQARQCFRFLEEQGAGLERLTAVEGRLDALVVSPSEDHRATHTLL